MDLLLLLNCYVFLYFPSKCKMAKVLEYKNWNETKTRKCNNQARYKGSFSCRLKSCAKTGAVSVSYNRHMNANFQSLRLVRNEAGTQFRTVRVPKRKREIGKEALKEQPEIRHADQPLPISPETRIGLLLVSLCLHNALRIEMIL